MKYGLSPLSVWLSPILLAPLIFSVSPLPHSQAAAGRSIWLLAPLRPTHPLRPAFNQPNTHTQMSLSIPPEM